MFRSTSTGNPNMIHTNESIVFSFALIDLYITIALISIALQVVFGETESNAIGYIRAYTHHPDPGVSFYIHRAVSYLSIARAPASNKVVVPQFYRAQNKRCSTFVVQ